MDHFSQSIDALLARIKEQEAEIAKNKTAVNALCAILNRPPMFASTDPAGQSVPLNNLRGDEFYGQPLSTVIRTILETRKAAGSGAATVTEIYAVMVEGGYKFETADEENAKRSLRISLTKNSQTFHKLPNGKYGLKEWYPSVREKKQTTQEASTKAADADDGIFDMEAKERADLEAQKKKEAVRATA